MKDTKVLEQLVHEKQKSELSLQSVMSISDKANFLLLLISSAF
jgi:hypothetical protein